MSTDVEITCTRCGKRLSLTEAAEHSTSCRPRWLHWWPRDRPWRLAWLAFWTGVMIGALLAGWRL